MIKIQSWEVSDSFWERVEWLIPAPVYTPEKLYKRKTGGGRKPIPPRRIFEAIIYVLRTGCQWKALPKKRFGSPNVIHTHFMRRMRTGFFVALWDTIVSKGYIPLEKKRQDENNFDENDCLQLRTISKL